MNELKSFVINFFENLKAEIKENDNVLTIGNIPKDFEAFYGKKGPYYFVFDKIKEDNQELITKGSFLIKIMSDYLSNRGQTTLVKLKFDINKEDLCKFLKFKNCELNSINKNCGYEYILRFTFQTNFQFLNGREQAINSIYVSDSKIIDFDLEKYENGDGKKQEFEMEDIKKDYSIAREHLKSLLIVRINKIGDYLNGKLEREVARIKQHYSNQIAESRDKITKLNNQIGELDKIKSEETVRKIVKIKEDIGKIDLEIIKDEKEETFFIKDEEHKHSLNINNSLINTTIIYYPIFKINLWLKNQNTMRMAEVIYNPMTKQLNSVRCNSCNLELSEISLCSSGHISCSNCLVRCPECGKDYCKNCMNKICSYCNKKLCSKCAVKCLKCGKYYCSSHIKKDAISGKQACPNCMKRCVGCQSYSEKLIKCICGREFCSRCERAFLNIGGRKLCNNCAEICNLCEKAYVKEEFVRCRACKSEFCNFPGKCKSCRRQLCKRFKG